MSFSRPERMLREHARGTPARRRWICRLSFALGLVLGCAPAAAQDALRGWSSVSFDTDAFALPALQIAAKGPTTAVLRADGRIYVNGQETVRYGGICRPPDPPPGLRYVEVAISTTNAVGILSDGTAVGWGAAPTIPPPPPQPPVPPAGTRYVQISVGTAHVLGLRSDGVVVGWGNDAFLTTLPPLPVGATVRTVHASYGWSLVHLSTGDVLAWGFNHVGQCDVPPLPTGTTYTEVFPGLLHSFARRSDGVVVSWGDNQLGQSAIPPLPPGVVYDKIAAGLRHTLALRSDGLLVGWGDNWSLQCEMPAVPAGRFVVQIAAGSFHSLALLSDGTVLGSPGHYLETPFVRPGAGARWVDVACGYYYTLSVTSDGQLHGSPTLPITTAPPLPPGVRYVKAVASWIHSAALRSDGQIVAWGDNSYGQCNVPPLPAGVAYTKVAIGERHTIALRSDGAAVAFGDPAFGATIIPPLPPGVRYVDADGASYQTILLRSDGTVVCVGIDNGGRLNPPPLPPGLSYVRVAAATFHNAAVRSDGELVLWGSSAFRLPVRPNGVAYVEISSGEYQTLARRSDGQVDVAYLGSSGIPIQWGEDRVPPLRPGESYVQVDAQTNLSNARVGPTTTYVSFGPGCAGTRPASRLVPRDTPRIGRTLEVRLFDLPANAAFMAFGWRRLQPVGLLASGLPCIPQISVDALAFLLGANGQAVYRLPIPDDPALVGIRFHNQAFVPDAAANPLGVVLSDAAEGVVGYP
jgi:alpha-tubulin suppressor-like RCC1 family protein